MSGMIELTAYSGKFLGPIAKVLGWIMSGIYDIVLKISGGTINSVPLAIVLMTILIYMCLLPLTIQQQKFSKLSQKMQPELNAIRDKYKNRKDQEAMMAMNQETQLVYQKYGISPSGSCIQMLIQMPILFALYRVFIIFRHISEVCVILFIRFRKRDVSWSGRWNYEYRWVCEKSFGFNDKI